MAGESVAGFESWLAVLGDFEARGRARLAEIDAVAGESVAGCEHSLAVRG